MWQYVLYFIILAASVFLLWMMHETRTLSVERLRIISGTNFKLVQISDIHISLLRVDIKKICNVIAREAPDAIVFTGDYIDKKKDISKVLRVFERITQSAAKANSSCVVTGCLGNHDYEALMDNNDKINDDDVEMYIKSINTAGVKILSNETEIAYSYDGSSVSLTGIDEARYKFANIEKAVASIKDKEKMLLRIGFGHNPDNSLDIPEGVFNIFLCGHFHGGQIWTPFGIEFRALRGEALCKHKIIKGHHIVKGMHLYISRGLGNVLVPLRFRSKPEITVICFTK